VLSLDPILYKESVGRVLEVARDYFAETIRGHLLPLLIQDSKAPEGLS
jgi:hypothetical protein